MIGNWSPRIGDPSFMGWCTVFSYYGAAILCLAAAARSDAKTRKSDRMFWIAALFLMALLGVCKQYNLPSAITEIGRIVARDGGWMQRRRIVQACIMAATTIGGILAAVHLIGKIPKPFLARHRLTVICLSWLVLFVTLRTISLHQWGTILSHTIFGMRINWIAELSGIFGVGLSALSYVIPRAGDDSGRFKK